MHLPQHRLAPETPPTVVGTFACVLTSSNRLSINPLQSDCQSTSDQPFLCCGKGVFILRFAEALQRSSPAQQ